MCAEDCRLRECTGAKQSAFIDCLFRKVLEEKMDFTIT